MEIADRSGRPIKGSHRAGNNGASSEGGGKCLPDRGSLRRGCAATDTGQGVAARPRRRDGRHRGECELRGLPLEQTVVLVGATGEHLQEDDTISAHLDHLGNRGIGVVVADDEVAALLDGHTRFSPEDRRR